MTLTAALALTAMGFAAGSGIRSTTAISHMCVTLVTPAAISQSQTLEINNIDLNNASAKYNGYGKIEIAGNHSTYALTVSGNNANLNNQGKSIAIDNFSAVNNMNADGTEIVEFGGSVKINDNFATTNNEKELLAVTVNYN